jgi:hypothetical protein
MASSMEPSAVGKSWYGARLGWLLPAGVQKTGGLVGQNRHAHIEQGHVDQLPLARAVAHFKSRQDGAAGVDTGEQVGQCHAHPLRPAARRAVGAASDAHHAAHGLDHQVVTGALGIGPGLTKAGD